MERRFFVLEVGTNPVENSTLEQNEIALIMDDNLGESAWCNDPINCVSDGNLYNRNGAITANKFLEDNTIGWNVEVSLPTASQGNAVSTPTNKFFWSNLTTAGDAYWTSTPEDYQGYPSIHDTYALAFTYYGGSGGITGSHEITNSYGIRPVITVTKG